MKIQKGYLWLQVCPKTTVRQLDQIQMDSTYLAGMMSFHQDRLNLAKSDIYSNHGSIGNDAIELVSNRALDDASAADLNHNIDYKNLVDPSVVQDSWRHIQEMKER